MKCYYEILKVSKDADLSEIKSAYRKFALQWHPDKNLNNEEYAKEQFQLIQQAYDVLSDPQERAWYDKHREQILKGSNSEYEDNSLDVFQYFTATCFKGYGDDKNGFYTVYRNVFDKIIEEDIEFIDEKEEVLNIPRFGNSTSDYDEIVGPFYSYWSNYCTKKSYVWLDPHNISEIRHRKTFKLIEKENKKVRTTAKKERNDEVRNLVAFVKKRDKRVQEHAKLLEAKILENRQKQENLSKQRRMQMQKQLNESGAQAEWTKFDNVKSELEEIEKHLAQEFGEELSNSEEEDEDSINDLYCVACNKIFKTSKALENHESSKKHKENVGKLKAFMLEEEEEEGNSDEETEKDENLDDMIITETVETVNDNTDKSSGEKVKKQKKKEKTSKNTIQLEEPEDTNPDIITTINENFDKDNDFSLSKKQKKKIKKQNKNTVIEDQIGNNTEKNEILTEKGDRNSKKKVKKDKKKEDISEIDTSHCCVTCKSDFPSKNKLFDHLKKTSHGVYLPHKKRMC